MRCSKIHVLANILNIGLTGFGDELDLGGERKIKMTVDLSNRKNRIAIYCPGGDGGKSFSWGNPEFGLCY